MPLALWPLEDAVSQQQQCSSAAKLPGALLVFAHVHLLFSFPPSPPHPAPLPPTPPHPTPPPLAAMNEMTWRKVMDWEQLHCQECKYPTLLKFQGRPHDLR
jgi:hypothetical protein